MAKERFEVLQKDNTGIFGIDMQVIVDKETGVQYLLARDGAGAGLAVMVDKEGRPLLANGYERKL